MKKIKTIVLSRFKKEKNQEDWVEVRRSFCKPCIHNSNNKSKISFKKRVLIWLSDFYSFITNTKDVDNLGNCTACDSCSIYFKTQEEYEKCPIDKWDYKLD